MKNESWREVQEKKAYGGNTGDQRRIQKEISEWESRVSISIPSNCRLATKSIGDRGIWIQMCLLRMFIAV